VAGAGVARWYSPYLEFVRPWVPSQKTNQQKPYTVNICILVYFNYTSIKLIFKISNEEGGCQWLVPVIQATWEAEIRRIKIQGLSGQIIRETPSPK
jgi:hypothetical protein